MPPAGAVACDTSVAVPLLAATHTAHPAVAAWAQGKNLALAGHAIAETYSVLTRLPGDIRFAPADATAAIDANFTTLGLDSDVSGQLHHQLAQLGLAGGATYDTVVAIAAREAHLPLATRDLRAHATYTAVGVQVIVVT